MHRHLPIALPAKLAHGNSEGGLGVDVLGRDEFGSGVFPRSSAICARILRWPRASAALPIQEERIGRMPVSATEHIGASRVAQVDDLVEGAELHQ